jgi:class 3 adenylate cyclase/pimeloyl-ACP methyl ester carboxylesterase
MAKKSGRTAVPESESRRLAAILAADIAGYSALMGVDETRTVRDLKGHQAVVLPMICEFGGRIIDTAGDGILAEFPSVVNAVKCAVAIQSKMAERNAAIDPERRMQFRIGVNLGDVIYDDTRIYGDGINVAARLESIAEPGGIFVSRQAYEQVEGKLALRFRELGPQHLKNIAKPVEVFAVHVDGTGRSSDAPMALRQEINYCRAPDGVRLAWAKAGRGPPLVRAATWMGHLEYEWESPLRRPAVQRLARNHTLIRYDARGTGLSDWDVDELSLEAWVRDLEAVVDAAGVDRFPLLGISQGAAISIDYSVHHPERVTHLVLCGGFALGGKKRSPGENEKRAAMTTLMRLGWGLDDPGFRQLFTSRMMPDATKEQADAFNELQRRATSPECAVRYFETVGGFDINDLLGQIRVPTLVMHVRGDLMNPFEEGRRMASAIPGARFVALQGNNHMMLPGEPAAVRFIEELELFLSH